MKVMNDKLLAWEERITQEPRDEVANVEYIELLYECRIIEEEVTA